MFIWFPVDTLSIQSEEPRRQKTKSVYHQGDVASRMVEIAEAIAVPSPHCGDDGIAARRCISETNSSSQSILRWVVFFVLDNLNINDNFSVQRGIHRQIASKGHAGSMMGSRPVVRVFWRATIHLAPALHSYGILLSE